jgi:hypothetical protein
MKNKSLGSEIWFPEKKPIPGPGPKRHRIRIRNTAHRINTRLYYTHTPASIIPGTYAFQVILTGTEAQLCKAELGCRIFFSLPVFRIRNV